MKRLFFLSLVSLMLLLCVPLAGCDSEEGLAAEQIAQIVEGVSDNKIDTCTFDMDISGTIDVDAFGQSMNMSILGWGEGCMDNVNQEMCIPLTFTMNADMPDIGNQSEVMSIKIYVVDGWMYMNTHGEWMKMEMPQEILGEQDQGILIEQLADLLTLVEIDDNGTETVNGVECYKFQIKPDMGQLAEYAFEQFPQEGMDVLDLDGLDEIMSSFDVVCTFCIAKKDNLLMKIDLDLGGELSSEDIPEMGGVDFGSMSMNMSMDLGVEIVFDYNQPVNIELPPGAAGAYDMGAYDTGW